MFIVAALLYGVAALLCVGALIADFYP